MLHLITLLITFGYITHYIWFGHITDYIFITFTNLPICFFKEVGINLKLLLNYAQNYCLKFIDRCDYNEHVLRLGGSYEAMDGGWTEDALVDFTGGIGYRIDLMKPADLPKNFYNTLLKHDEMSSLMGCSITVSWQT